MVQGSSEHAGSKERRVQLRKPAGIGLIKRLCEHRISEVTDRERRDFAQLVAVTERGRDYTRRFDEAKANP